MTTSIVDIGEFYIQPAINKGKIWIGRQDGEGGEFPIDELEKAIKEFYDERF
jgi:hypothetical protein